MTQEKNKTKLMDNYTAQGLTELQTKLANLVLGLKSDPTELDALGGGGDGGAQLPPPNGTLPAQVAAAPRAAGWGQEASPSGWGGTAGTPGSAGGGGGAGAGGWGTSPAGGGGTAWGGGSGSGAGTSPSAGGWGSNAASGSGGAWGTGGNSSGWGTTGSPARNPTGWSSPNPQTQSGWNV